MTPVTAIIRSLRDEPDMWHLRGSILIFSTSLKNAGYIFEINLPARCLWIRHHIRFDLTRLAVWRIRRAIKRWEKVNVA
jgi:hypothetical protein